MKNYWFLLALGLFIVVLTFIIVLFAICNEPLRRKMTTTDRITAKENFVENDNGDILLKGLNIIVLDQQNKTRLRIFVAENDSICITRLKNHFVFELHDPAGQ